MIKHQPSFTSFSSPFQRALVRRTAFSWLPHRLTSRPWASRSSCLSRFTRSSRLPGPSRVPCSSCSSLLRAAFRFTVRFLERLIHLNPNIQVSQLLTDQCAHLAPRQASETSAKGRDRDRIDLVFSHPGDEGVKAGSHVVQPRGRAPVSLCREVDDPAR